MYIEVCLKKKKYQPLFLKTLTSKKYIYEYIYSYIM